MWRRRKHNAGIPMLPLSKAAADASGRFQRSAHEASFDAFRPLQRRAVVTWTYYRDLGNCWRGHSFVAFYATNIPEIVLVRAQKRLPKRGLLSLSAVCCARGTL